MPNEQNLIPFSERSQSEARENGRKGGIASGKARRRKRSLKEAADLFLSLPVADVKTRNIMDTMGLDEEDIDNQMAMIVGLQLKAMKGNAKAARLLFDLLEPMDKDAEENTGSEEAGFDSRLFELIAPPFLSTLQSALMGKLDEIVEKGGRGSTKSSFCSILLWALLKKHPECHAVCFRRYGNTLRNSVFAQMWWALNELEPGKWEKTVSPMEMTHKETGQKILFFGLDDEAKLKSIKLPFGYIGMVWFEELDQYDGLEQIRNVEQSCLRGGDFAFTLKSFNPPMSPRNWANKYAMETRPQKLVQHTDYRTTPVEWLGQSFVDRAEYLKESNPTAYKHEYLGDVTGCGKEVFTNIQIQRISGEKISSFDRIYHGVDWGWYPDPWAYNACYYDAGHKTLYIYDELTRLRTANEDTFKLLTAKNILQTNGERLTADSAEQKSCADYTRWGLRCLPAIKGPGSVEQGCKWLQSLNAIVIDPERCPDTAKEFLEYEYEADKDGTPIPGYPDYNNHHIDAIRYALESVWRRPGQ